MHNNKSYDILLCKSIYTKTSIQNNYKSNYPKVSVQSNYLKAAIYVGRLFDCEYIIIRKNK